jgi:hypothetical protein
VPKKVKKKRKRDGEKERRKKGRQKREGEKREIREEEHVKGGKRCGNIFSNRLYHNRCISILELNFFMLIN